MWVWWRMEWDEYQNFSKFSRSNCQTVGWIYKGISLLMTLRNTWQYYILVAKAKWMWIQAMNVRDKISHMTCHQERNLQQVCSKFVHSKYPPLNGIQVTSIQNKLMILGSKLPLIGHPSNRMKIGPRLEPRSRTPRRFLNCITIGPTSGTITSAK